MSPRGVIASLLLCALLWGADPARGHMGVPFGGGFRLGLGGHAELVALGRVEGGDHFGGVEVQGSASLMSIGLAAGLAYERVPRDGRLQQGAHLHIAFQWRPLQLAGGVHRWFDPHVGLGGQLGGGDFAGASTSRATLFAGAGMDIALAGGSVHPVLAVQYRVQIAQTDASTRHLVLLGLGARWAK